jgi:hypothetical protein
MLTHLKQLWFRDDGMSLLLRGLQQQRHNKATNKTSKSTIASSLRTDLYVSIAAAREGNQQAKQEHHRSHRSFDGDTKSFKRGS